MRWIARAAQILGHVDGSPARVAAAFGIGVFVAFFPILGIHTALALLIAIMFRLNKVAILIGAWLNNPWTIAPMYSAGTLLGCVLLRVPLVNPASSVEWSLTGQAFYEALATSLAPLLWPFVIGNLALGAALGLAGFLVLRSVLSRRRSSPPATGRLGQ
jgi:uncharacterized protein (DUF2062 family)